MITHYLIWTIVLSIATFVITRLYKRHRFFTDWGIPHPKEYPILGFFGMNAFLKRHINYAYRDLYNLSKEAKYVGCHVFTEPIILVRDLELAKTLLVKSFDHFDDRDSFVDEAVDPLFAKNLFSLSGDKWREMRNLLSPSFTLNRMRSMFVLMSECAENFVRQLLELRAGAEATDLKDSFTRYTNDVIATCAFGIEIDSMRNPENEFYLRGKRSVDFGRMKWRITLATLLPRCLRKYVRIIGKDDTDFFVKVIEDAIETRKKRGIVRPDMLQLMMEAQGKSGELDLLEMTAQAFIFFFGGFESTASHMCMMAYELALRPEVQAKLQDEIDGMMRRSQGKPSYEDVNEMPYLDAVFAETMRLHPLASLRRSCSKSFELPPAIPSAKPFTIEPGMQIFFPTVGIHRDPDFFEDPDEFVAERFVDGKKPFATEVTNMGFGLGPRMCIGNRFAILETKVLFVHLLAKCNLEPCKETCIPLVYDENNLTPAPRGGTQLKIVLRKS